MASSFDAMFDVKKLLNFLPVIICPTSVNESQTWECKMLGSVECCVSNQCFVKEVELS